MCTSYDISGGCFNPEVILFVVEKPVSLQITLLCCLLYIEETVASVTSWLCIKTVTFFEGKKADVTRKKNFILFSVWENVLHCMQQIIIGFFHRVYTLPLPYIQALNLLFKKAFNFVLYLNS